MQETAEELEFGNMIVLDLSKDMKNGHTKHLHLECKFIPELATILLEEGVIVEKEIKEDKPLDFQDDDTPCSLMEEVIKANEKLELRVDKLEKTVIKLREMIAALAIKSAAKPKPYKNARKQNRK